MFAEKLFPHFTPVWADKFVERLRDVQHEEQHLLLVFELFASGIPEYGVAMTEAQEAVCVHGSPLSELKIVTA